MKLFVQQTIQIQYIKIGTISNSAVFQIGTSGLIRPSTSLYNTGGFINPVPSLSGQSTTTESMSSVPAFTPKA